MTALHSRQSILLSNRHTTTQTNRWRMFISLGLVGSLLSTSFTTNQTNQTIIAINRSQCITTPNSPICSIARPRLWSSDLSTPTPTLKPFLLNVHSNRFTYHRHSLPIRPPMRLSRNPAPPLSLARPTSALRREGLFSQEACPPRDRGKN
eukprot:m.330825 g.330825  ORF g.330825 m.330825 type:complete len:150 (-) comp55612_c3_seq4:940-1389(-)